MDPLDSIVQYGFAGFCAVLLGILIWLAKAFMAVVSTHNDQLVALTKNTTDVVRDNSEAIREVKAIQERQVQVLDELHKEMLKRPHLARSD